MKLQMTLGLALLLPSSVWALTPLTCNTVMQDSGMLTPVSNVIEETANQLAYMREFMAFHEKRGTQGYLLSSIDTLRSLESEYGPPITFTTFSRELSATEHYEVAEQVLGVLSNLPSSGAIIVSGGTMGERSAENAIGGGVGITQSASTEMGFKTLSITASKAFQYRAAHADYLYFTMGGFSTESRTMYEVSKALVVIGGGGQAYNEAVEYLAFNPNGYLVVVDSPEVGGASKKVLDDPRFAELAKVHPHILIARNGSEAGIILTEKLGLRMGDQKTVTLAAAKNRVNRLSANTDFHMLMPNSKIVGFSGWSDFDRSLPDAVPHAKEISAKIQGALKHVHEALMTSDHSLLYATAGNDPALSKSGVPAFETFVHNLSLDGKGKHIAFTAKTVDLNELNAKISAVAFVSPDWEARTFQVPARSDLFITAGGNRVVIDQAIQAATLKRPHLHIAGANTLTDMRIESLRNSNPKLVVASPEEIQKWDSQKILEVLGLK